MRPVGNPTAIDDDDLLDFATSFDPEVATESDIFDAVEAGQTKLVMQLLAHLFEDIVREVHDEIQNMNDELADLPQGVTAKDVSDLKASRDHYEALSEKLTEDSVRYKDGQKKKIKAMKDEIRDLEFKLEEKVHQVATLSNLIRSAEQVKGQHRDLRELHEKFVQKFHVLEESMASLQQEKVAIQDNLDSVLARCAEVEHEKTDLGYKFESCLFVYICLNSTEITCLLVF